MCRSVFPFPDIQLQDCAVAWRIHRQQLQLNLGLVRLRFRGMDLGFQAIYPGLERLERKFFALPFILAYHPIFFQP